MANALRFGILGTGHMAQTMAHCLRATPGVAVAGFASRDPQRASSIGAAHGALASYGTLEDMLTDPSVGAIYIANESSAHAAAAIAAIEAGKPVLCEKPCGINATQARAIAEASTRHGTLFMEAIATPFLPAVASVLDPTRAGQLGVLRHLSADFGYPATAQSHPSCFARHGGGVLLDRSIYLVTLALIALGPVKTIKAEVSRNADGIDVEAWLMLTHNDGAVSTLGASLLSELGNRMSIAGTGGSAFIDAPLLAAERPTFTTVSAIERAPPPSGDFASRLKQSPTLRRLRAVMTAAKTPHVPYGHSLYAMEVAHFRDLVLSGAKESPILPPSRSVATLAIIDAARAMTA